MFFRKLTGHLMFGMYDDTGINLQQEFDELRHSTEISGEVLEIMTAMKLYIDSVKDIMRETY